MSRPTLSRRQFLQIIAVGGIAGAAAKLSFDAWKRMEAISETRLLMGTVVNLTVVSDDPDRATSAIKACLDQMEDLERVMSRFIPDSQLSQLNRDGYLGAADPALVQVVAESQKISRLSSGAFDITIKPLLDAAQSSRSATAAERAAVGYQNLQMEGSQITLLKPGMGLTLDGIAKGFIVDAGTVVLKKLGFENVYVEAGGDLMTSGKKETDTPWMVGIRSPRNEQPGLLARINVNNQAVATSGDYFQYFSADMLNHHIIDPRIGSSSTELASVTIVSENAMHSDALATAVMVLGTDDGLELIESIPNSDAYLVTKDLEVAASSGFSQYVRR